MFHVCLKTHNFYVTLFYFKCTNQISIENLSSQVFSFCTIVCFCLNIVYYYYSLNSESLRSSFSLIFVKFLFQLRLILKIHFVFVHFNSKFYIRFIWLFSLYNLNDLIDEEIVFSFYFFIWDLVFDVLVKLLDGIIKCRKARNSKHTHVGRTASHHGQQSTELYSLSVYSTKPCTYFFFISVLMPFRFGFDSQNRYN